MVLEKRKCRNCGMEFEPKKLNQECCTPECRQKHWNKEMLEGLKILKCMREEYPGLFEQLAEYAGAHDASFAKMVCKMLAQSMNPDRQPINNEFGGDVK